jgi:tRNA-2-methylthio-N6-dimethylallyladenosine synthase
MNEHDVEKVSALLHTAGYEKVREAAGADVVIVNTCCVREKAEQKFYSLMGRLKTLKRRKGTLLGVTGCIAQLEKEGLAEKLPFIDFSLGPSSIHRIREAVESATRNKRFLDFSDNGCAASLHVRPRTEAGTLKAYVTIMKGCDNYCSYCIVPYVRGREKSRQSSDILEEIRGLAGRGVKDVTLLGQNVNSYNKGDKDLSFPELLSKVNDINGIERIHFVTSHPKDLSRELIDCFGSLEKLCEHIHLPFQSGSDKILRLMNRGYTVEEFSEKLDLLKNRCNNIAVTSDCIVGFPGEGEKDFEATMTFVKSVRFDGLFSFCFSPRKFTRAADLPDGVPREEAMRRLQELQSIQKVITRERNRALEGTKAEVLAEGVSKNSSLELTGRTRSNKIVNFEGGRNLVGELVEVAIIKGCANSLKGAQVKDDGNSFVKRENDASKQASFTSEHGSREGEAPRALPEEGATRAPLLYRKEVCDA